MTRTYKVAVTFCLFAGFAGAQTSTNTPDLRGVYRNVPQSASVPGGLKNSGSLDNVQLTPEAAQQTKAVDLKQDPARMCHPVGILRTMAGETKFEFVPGPGMWVMLFEDLSHDHMRELHLNRSHSTKKDLTWEGDSVAHWDGDTLVIDTIGFNDQTWLNAAGAQHSEALHLAERIRPIQSGKYIEYKVTADDPKSLAKPLTMTRYFEKTDREITDNVCVETGEVPEQ